MTPFLKKGFRNHPALGEPINAPKPLYFWPPKINKKFGWNADVVADSVGVYNC